MVAFTTSDFEELCRCKTVQKQIGSIETCRAIALRKFWFYFFLGVAVSFAAYRATAGSGWENAAWYIFIFSLLGSFSFALMPLWQVSEGLKHPALDRLASMAGMEFAPDGFEPPAFAIARPILFGSLTSQSFSDLSAVAEGETIILCFRAKFMRFNAMPAKGFLRPFCPTKVFSNSSTPRRTCSA